VGRTNNGDTEKQAIAVELNIFWSVNLWWFEEEMEHIEIDKSDNLYYIEIVDINWHFYMKKV
jgi:hypothetical protein